MSIRAALLLVLCLCATLGEAQAPQEQRCDALCELAAQLEPQRPMPPGTSLGTTSSGSLVDGIALPLDAEHVFVMPRQRKREHHYAARNLAEVVAFLAEQVHGELSGARLQLGDASGVQGGRIPRHSSHACGRDLDIAFFALGADGKSAELSDFERFDERGESSSGKRFDLERNWRLVEAVLDCGEPGTPGEALSRVQYLFIYDGLRKLLLEEGQRQGVSAERMRRAAALLRQPGDSAPHDDHYHLRVYCSLDDRLNGCVNWGPNWPWAERHEREAAAFGERIVGAWPSLDAAAREPALTRLASLGSPLLGGSVLRLAFLRPVEERAQLFELAFSLGFVAQDWALLEAALPQVETQLQSRLIRALGSTGTEMAAFALARVLAQYPEHGLQTVRSLAALRSEASVAVLLAALADPELGLVEELEQALRRLTNQELSGLEAWQRWYAEHGEGSIEEWWA
ncbi:MAG: penicillin-insensitive murein endopeptidase, partial [Myxococcota bacterium]|nr:penicillin-insensitive murein endopeptidase [Myxococcota bacterium]